MTYSVVGIILNARAIVANKKKTYKMPTLTQFMSSREKQKKKIYIITQIKNPIEKCLTGQDIKYAEEMASYFM